MDHIILQVCYFITPIQTYSDGLAVFTGLRVVGNLLGRRVGFIVGLLDPVMKRLKAYVSIAKLRR